jgi:hypothetical protein
MTDIAKRMRAAQNAVDVELNGSDAESRFGFLLVVFENLKDGVVYYNVSNIKPDKNLQSNKREIFRNCLSLFSDDSEQAAVIVGGEIVRGYIKR